MRLLQPGRTAPEDHEHVDGGVDEELGNECEAFLSGTWAEHRSRHDLPVPVWAWLNQAAHADEATLRAAAAGEVRTTPTEGNEIQTLVARALLAACEPDRITTVQQTALVPLELELIGTVLSPRRAVELATSALFA